MAEIGVEIIGLDDLTRKLNNPFAAQPARNFLNRGTLLIQREARGLAPVDTGRLVDSIATEIDTALVPLWGTVGTNLAYAPYVEFGTRPHMPPPAALEGWARRHGMPGQGYAIALGILHHGTEGQRFLRGGADAATGAITGLVPVFAAELEAAAAEG